MKEEEPFIINWPPEPPAKTLRERVHEDLFIRSGFAMGLHLIAVTIGIYSISTVTWWGKLLTTCHNLVFLALIAGWAFWAFTKYSDE